MVMGGCKEDLGRCDSCQEVWQFNGRCERY